MKTLVVTTLSVLALTIAATAEADKQRFRYESKTVLTADQEVQAEAVVSAGKALAIISINRRFTRATIRVTFSNLEGDVSRLHLHCNVAGANGPIAIGAVDLVGAANDNSETITLDANTITGKLFNSQFPGADACAGAIGRSIRNLHELAQAIDDGQVYWNLHTFAFPAGELRGQVEPLQRTTPARLDRDDD
ncbi:MAG: CHRD domain-containing protein [Pseudomonadota bacterium]